VHPALVNRRVARDVATECLVVERLPRARREAREGEAVCGDALCGRRRAEMLHCVERTEA
jgi:hypothetical protein